MKENTNSIKFNKLLKYLEKQGMEITNKIPLDDNSKSFVAEIDWICFIHECEDCNSIAIDFCVDCNPMLASVISLEVNKFLVKNYNEDVGLGEIYYNTVNDENVIIETAWGVDAVKNYDKAMVKKIINEDIRKKLDIQLK